ncbi:MAG: hypothetical protein HC933_02215 [Pleurocapsa sp. SU_196_0]|nr:hypothetical protein [Pleurocapsa sp. SU_196_0]
MRTDDDTQILYAGPANVSAPSRSWQQAAALEGEYDATVMIHSAADLTRAASVAITRHPMAGEYKVVSNRISKHDWSLALVRVARGENAR